MTEVVFIPPSDDFLMIIIPIETINSTCYDVGEVKFFGRSRSGYTSDHFTSRLNSPICT